MSRPEREVINFKSLSLIGIPAEFHDKTLSDFNLYNDAALKEVAGYVKEYIENIDNMFSNNCGIFFSGSNGVGKSFLSCLILMQAYKKRYTVIRCTLADYISRRIETWNAKEGIEEFIDRYDTAEFFNLEEVGKELSNDLSITLLESLLRFREEKGLPTIICTNLNFSTITSRYGASVSSLLKGNYTPITIQGADRRQEIYKERVKNAEQ